MSCKWSEDHAPERLHNEVSEYPVVAEIRNEYTQELMPYPEGLIPLMTILQQNKTEVRSVIAYRELNHCIDMFTASADVCVAKLREW